ncbi:MAG: hypothetical protein IPI85_00305 [Dehalococcoidia bacterium]|nr:hypothetical protein [Dehalococcoidia bacterium]
MRNGNEVEPCRVEQGLSEDEAVDPFGGGRASRRKGAIRARVADGDTGLVGDQPGSEVASFDPEGVDEDALAADIGWGREQGAVRCGH